MLRISASAKWIENIGGKWETKRDEVKKKPHTVKFPTQIECINSSAFEIRARNIQSLRQVDSC